MTFAGAIEITPQEVALILAILAIAAIGSCAVGGAIAWLISGRRRAFWLGFVAIPAGALAAVWVGLPDLGVPAALAASVLAGVVSRPRTADA